MKIDIIAIGKARNRCWSELYQDYAIRLGTSVNLIEIDDRRGRGNRTSSNRTGGNRAASSANDEAKSREARNHEARLMIERIPPAALVIALDETGLAMTSRQLSSQMEKWRNQGRSSLCFLIGGADGLGESARERADHFLSLGPLTLPHQLARLILIEQLYRAQSISNNHPYHRD